ncbi:DNA-binding MurR/RpiR family transcriptional regulator [Amycolatopsis bartoniae]|uniref:RpiR family transcriptional regulator n=1 Tax=Amycolatopsis bartoniae TaxID=941986 RepID=A0A8H9MB67_9PSEU|nr:MurR/RpiR family transcriptional regulator [Amycolatopsis bartoniae]MBB2934998.1 DNA-binding MurR/RpiR family transcriptional regulator [Amycolatopsis bartoniae]GHF43209.1 RpiR family transcriptional regulator [Amycolatopsis bartoniae]
MLAELIREHAANLSRTDRVIAEHLLEHQDELPFLRAAEIAERLGVSAASITRFAQRLGFDGYPRLQDSVRLELRTALTPPTLPDQGEGRFGPLWDRELKNLEELRRLPEDLLDGAARMIADARNVWVVGGRASQAPAEMLAYSLGRVRDRVRSLRSDTLHEPEALLDLGPGDLLVALSFRRYSSSTARIGRLFADRDVPILLVTDDGHPSLASLAKLVLRVSGKSLAALPSMTAVTSLSLALTLGVVAYCGTDRLEAGERLGRELHAFED